MNVINNGIIYYIKKGDMDCVENIFHLQRNYFLRLLKNLYFL